MGHLRVELLTVISQFSRLLPERRLGQTLANLAATVGRMDAGGMRWMSMTITR